ncbi:hypothetical protein NPIL_536771 [Nephila pilipes]|uniref:Uncharacterized protein n=1 Tax=Nephila pilipes TaxID=299642 RepID=A0A8X6MVN1_NEPPI|nr:hypothetical protein NPIL_536771 [Nephila pilipes]
MQYSLVLKIQHGKETCLELFFPFPMNKNPTKIQTGRIRRQIHIEGGSEPFCGMFGCNDDDDEHCSVPPGAQCCEGYSYDSRSGQCRYEVFK